MSALPGALRRCLHRGVERPEELRRLRGRLSSGQACSAGGCSSTCLPGLSICAGSCVDTSTDSASCGTCGNKCPAGTGCVDGACKPSVTLARAREVCGRRAPIISMGRRRHPAPVRSPPRRSPGPSARAGRGGLEQAPGGRVRQHQGPYKPGELGGGVGANVSSAARARRTCGVSCGRRRAPS